MKKVFSTKEMQDACLITRKDAYNFIMNKYYNLFVNDFEIDGVGYQEKNFILKRFWSEGRIATFIIKGTKNSKEYPNGLLAFTDFAPCEYNIYDYPVKCTLINKKGVPFIPHTIQEIDKDVVLGYCQRNEKSIKTIVDYYARKISAVEMAIQMNTLAQQMPFLMATSPENKVKMEEFWKRIVMSDPVLFMDAQDIESIKVLLTQAPYNADKLCNLKATWENELREILGFNNLGVQEKKEHLINKEIAANDAITQNSGDAILDCMIEFQDKILDVLGVTITFTRKKTSAIIKEEATDEYQDEEEQFE